eukprot:g5132.t1
MAEVGHPVPSLDTQEAVGDWIYSKAQGGGELGSVGGTPRRVFNALLACGKLAEGPRRTGDTKKFSPCYVEIKSDTDEKLGSFIKFALGKKYPVALANPKRGQFTLTRDNNKKWSGLAGSKNTKYQLTTDVSVWTVATDGKHVFGRSDACDALTAQKP